MNSEEKFKELLTDKLGSKEFTFDQRHWNDMSARIDRSREKKFRGAWLWILCLISLSGSVAVYLYSSDKQHTANNQLAVRKTIHPATATTSTPKPLNQQVLTSDRIKVTSKPQAIPAQPREKAHPILAKSEKMQATHVTKPEVTSSAAEPVAPSDTKQPQIPVAPVASSDETAADEGKNSIVNIADAQTPSVAIEPPVAQVTNDSPSAVDSTVTEPIVVDQAAVAASIRKVDSASPAVQDNIVLPEDPGFTRHSFFAEAGANYLNGWKTNDTRDGRGLNFTGGVNYLYAINRKLGISGGLHYTETGHLSAWSHVSKSKSYSFGERTDVTVITPEKISYLQLPLKVNYMVTSQDVFGAGYVFGYLLTVKSKVETSGQGYGYTPNGSSSVTKGYTEGFNLFDSQVSVFYRRRFFDRWWLNAELLLGVMDSRKNDFFGNPVAERNSGLKLSVMYTIFQK